MIRPMTNLKALILTLALVAGWTLQCSDARARDMQVLTVAGGCFWCVEADFETVRGVTEVISGYTGGHVADPTYRQVTRGGTGHYEAVQIIFDADIVGARQLYSLFFRSVDPTDPGGQFCDRGDSYRTAIFVSDPAQRAAAEDAKAEAEAALGQPIVTPILDAGPFYVAEAYHQDYYAGTNIVLTRGGPKRQSEAYDFYREACGRDARVRQIWGDDAPFIH